VDQAETIIVSLLLAVVVLSAAARALDVPYPIVMVLGGMVLGLAQTLGAQYDPAFALLAGHIIFLAVLAFRPQGLIPASRYAGRETEAQAASKSRSIQTGTWSDGFSQART